MQPYYPPGNRLYPSASVVVCCYRAKNTLSTRSVPWNSVPFRSVPWNSDDHQRVIDKYREVPCAKGEWPCEQVAHDTYRVHILVRTQRVAITPSAPGEGEPSTANEMMVSQYKGRALRF